MSSLLLTFYDDLEAMAVTYTDKNGATVTANCLNIDEKADSLQTAHLPARVLTINNTNTAEIELGGNSKATWTITDLFFLETAARDAGAYILEPVLLRYQVAYLEAIQKKWQLVHGWSTETLAFSVTMRAGKLEYPAGSGTWFYGCECVTTFEELV